MTDLFEEVEKIKRHIKFKKNELPQGLERNKLLMYLNQIEFGFDEGGEAKKIIEQVKEKLGSVLWQKFLDEREKNRKRKIELLGYLPQSIRNI